MREHLPSKKSHSTKQSLQFVLRRHDKVLFVFFAAALLSSFLLWTFEEQFNEKKWLSNTKTRYKMADDLIESDLLIGNSKDEVIKLLGRPYDTNIDGQENLVYRLGKPPSFSKLTEALLIVTFESDNVTKVIRSDE